MLLNSGSIKNITQRTVIIQEVYFFVIITGRFSGFLFVVRLKQIIARFYFNFALVVFISILGVAEQQYIGDHFDLVIVCRNKVGFVLICSNLDFFTEALSVQIISNHSEVFWKVKKFFDREVAVLIKVTDETVFKEQFI